MNKENLVAQLKALVANVGCEIVTLRQEKKDCKRWSGNWHQLDGQIKALLWASREIKSLLKAARG